MGQMKAWGMKLFEAVETKFMESGDLKKAALAVFEDYKATGQYEDLTWLKDQIDYVIEYPEIFGGHPTNHWENLKKARREAAGRKHRIPKRGDYGN